MIGSHLRTSQQSSALPALTDNYEVTVVLMSPSRDELSKIASFLGYV
jgi:hypothetical protein